MLRRATELFIELCGGELVGGPIMAGEFSFEKRKVILILRKLRNIYRLIFYMGSCKNIGRSWL